MNNQILGEEKISKLLGKFSIPCIISLLIGALYNIVDQIFIGNSSLGYLGNAAVGVCFPLVMIAQAFAWGIGDGAAAYLNLCQGKGEIEKADKAIGGSITLTVVISIILGLISVFLSTPLLNAFGATKDNFQLAKDYIIIVGAFFPAFIFSNMLTSIIRADGSPNYSMFAILSGAILNIILDPLLIYVFDMGIKGAAWATVLGQIVSLILCVAYLFKSKTFKLSWKDFKIQGKYLLNAIRLGVSSFITQISIVVVTIVLNLMLKKYGSLSIYGPDIPLSVISILTKVYSIVINISVGIVLGGQPIIGYNYGAGRIDRVKETYKLIVFFNIIVGVVATLLFMIFPKEIISIFGSSDNTLYIDFGIRAFRIYLMFILFTCLIKMTAVFFQAVGEPIKAIVGALVRDLVIFVPLILIVPVLFESNNSGSGIYGVLIAAPIADVVGMLIALAMNIIFFKKIKYKYNRIGY